jgi:deoxyribodipyrimidine photo-lyase
VRRYVPELANVPVEYIHAPWTMPKSVADKLGVKLGRNYPLPIIDHKEARSRALAAFEAARKTEAEEK